MHIYTLIYWSNFKAYSRVSETRPTIKQATQSSEHVKRPRPAGNAVAKDLNLVAVTSYPANDTENPWWMLEYQCEQTITGVTIYNRIDSGGKLFLSCEALGISLVYKRVYFKFINIRVKNTYPNQEDLNGSPWYYFVYQIYGRSGDNGL